MKRILVIIILLAIIMTGCSKDSFTTEKYNYEVENGKIYGTLTLPKGKGPFPVALIIQGSGPTDRDGNNPISGKNDSLKMIAEALGNAGIASLRYDKRGIGESMDLIEKEEDLVFEDYIIDSTNWIGKLQGDGRFNSYYIIGHSEGALIGAAAANMVKLDGFISIAGMGESVYETLDRQLKPQPGDIHERSMAILDELRKGNLVPNPPEDLAALFRPSVQPYLISWLKYDPKEVISKLDCPILILQGDNDLQIRVEDAKMLHEAVDSKMVIIENMNHILKDSPRDNNENMKTYSDPKLPLNEELKKEIIDFIKK